MKKNYFLLSTILLASCMMFAQNKTGASKFLNYETKVETDDLKPITEDGYSKKRISNKLFGDTLYYQDFGGGLPTGWSIVNNNANNFQWEWDTVAKNGVSTVGVNAINSTTASNGFMSLPSDFYNTPRPVGGSVPMDTYFESDTITILPKNSVWVSYQQFFVYCCLDASLTGNVRILLQVSTDNFTTTTNFLLNDGVPSNTINTSNAQAGETNQINISSAVAGATDFKVRFYADGITNYIWYIDDFAVIEGPQNDLVLSEERMQFNWDNNSFNPFYGQIPYNLFPALPFSGDLYNNGSSTATKARLEVDVRHTASASGGSGTGLVYSTVTNDTTLPADSGLFVLTPLPRFVPLVTGDFEVDYFANMDSTDQDLSNNSGMLGFSISDTIFAVDDNAFGGGTGSGAYVRGGSPGGTAVGDRFATKYIVESNTGNGVHSKPTSVTFAVSDDVVNIGVEIVPKIWLFLEDSLFSTTVTSLDQAIGAEVASSFIPYTVTASDTNSFLTLPFDNGAAFTAGMDTGQYIVGFEVTSIAGGTNFEVRNDFTSSLLQPNFQTFLYFGHSPGWGLTGDNPVIRLNMGNLPVSTGINSSAISNVSFQIAPNPNNGLFNLNINTESQVNYNLNVRNMLGQAVYTDLLSINGSLTKTLDLTRFEKGVYFVSLENENEKLVKKVVLK